jgi:hypothetical protein
MPLGAPLPADARLAVRGAAGTIRVVAQPVPAPRAGLPVLGRGACLASVQWARGAAGEVAAAWWVVRPDSSVTLRLARSADEGARWEEPRTADSSDRGARGCARPSPALATDPLSGYTHLAYFIEPASGAGVFYEHLMDLTPASAGGATGGARAGSGTNSGRGTAAVAAPSDAAMFHAPVAIVYGEIPARTSVAAHGDTVVVAYEDPNRMTPEIALAVSLTAGHTFAAALTASPEGVAARDPAVVVRDSTVAVAWRETAVGPDLGTAADTLPGRAVARVGTIQ